MKSQSHNHFLMFDALNIEQINVVTKEDEKISNIQQAYDSVLYIPKSSVMESQLLYTNNFCVNVSNRADFSNRANYSSILSLMNN